MVASGKRYWKTIYIFHVSRSLRQEGAWQSQVYKNRITTTQLVIYANFKRILYQQDSCEPWSSNFFMIQYQHHVPYRSCIYVKCSDGWYFEAPQVNIGDDSAKKFLEQLLPAATFCRQHLPNKIPMKRLT